MGKIGKESLKHDGPTESSRPSKPTERPHEEINQIMRLVRGTVIAIGSIGGPMRHSSFGGLSHLELKLGIVNHDQNMAG